MISHREARSLNPLNSPPQSRPWLANLLVCALLVIATFAVYSQAWTLSFINVDDPVYASQNADVQAGLSLKGLRWSVAIHDCNWIPLTWLSLMLDSNIYGTGPAGYHLTNVLLHTANALLLFFALAIATESRGRSAFVAALFALHPLHVESVAWVAERKDLLSIFFGLASLLAYVTYGKNGKAWRLGAALLLFLSSLLAKPTLVTLPFVLLLLDYWPLGRLKAAEQPVATPRQTKRSRRAAEQPVAKATLISGPLLLRRLGEKIPFFAAAAAFCVIALYSQSVGGAMTAPLTFSVRWRNAVCAYLAYLEKTAYPVDLAVYYPHQGYSIHWTSVAAAASILLTLTAATIVLIRRYPFLFVGWFWYLGALVPMVGFVQIGTQQMADRYSYFPLIGVFLAAVWLMAELVPAGFLRQRALPLAGVAWLLLLASIAFSQVSYWHDSVTLLRHAQSCTPDNSTVHEFLGAALLGESLPDEAVNEFRAAIRLAGPYAPLHSDLASAFEALGRKDEALEQYRMAAQLDPQSIVAENGISRLLTDRGQFDEARRHLQRALELDPSDALTYANLAFLAMRTGDYTKGLAQANRGLELDPHMLVCELRAAQALRGLGRFDEAIQRLRHLADMVPNDPLIRQELSQTLEQQRATSGK
jgi:protein O-mannosyl-transferase